MINLDYKCMEYAEDKQISDTNLENNLERLWVFYKKMALCYVFMA